MTHEELERCILLRDKIRSLEEVLNEEKNLEENLKYKTVTATLIGGLDAELRLWDSLEKDIKKVLINELYTLRNELDECLKQGGC